MNDMLQVRGLCKTHGKGPGAVAGIPVGIGLYLLFTPGRSTMPPTGWLLAAALAAPLATALLTALPARIAAHRSVAQTLSAEAT